MRSTGTRFAAQNVALVAGNELEQRYQAVEKVASDEQLRRTMATSLESRPMRELLSQLNAPNVSKDVRAELQAKFQDLPERLTLQRAFAGLVDSVAKPGDDSETASWFLCDPQGVSVARSPQGRTIGKNYAWRSFFHGGPSDRDELWRPGPNEHISKTQFSAVFRSQATSRWIIAIATPIFDDSPSKRFLGVVGRTAEVGRFINFPGTDRQFAVLIDYREGKNQGLVLQHPLLDAMLAQGELPDRFKTYRLSSDGLPDTRERRSHYVDPMGADAEGDAYNQQWLAEMEPVLVRGEKTGWLVIVQEAYGAAIGSALSQLRAELVRYGLVALGFFAIVMAGLWIVVVRLARKY